MRVFLGILSQSFPSLSGQCLPCECPGQLLKGEVYKEIAPLWRLMPTISQQLLLNFSSTCVQLRWRQFKANWSVSKGCMPGVFNAIK